MKNKLAENMLRFGIKNLNESEVEKLQGLAEQSSGDVVTNITLALANMLSGTDMARIQGDSDIYTFPSLSDNGESVEGDVATYNGQSVLYAVGGNQYVVIGELGKLKLPGDTVINRSPQILTFQGTPYTGTSQNGGNNVKLSPFKQPLPAANPAQAIVRLAKAFRDQIGIPGGAKFSKDFVTTNNGKKFINKMVSVFKAAGLAQDVADMDEFYKSVANYI